MIEYNRWRRAATTTTTTTTTTTVSFQQTPRLINVLHIQASSLAFAAVRSDGSVVTWGTPHAGGDSSSVQDQLHDVLLGQSKSWGSEDGCDRITIGLVANVSHVVFCFGKWFVLRLFQSKLLTKKVDLCDTFCLNEVGCNTILKGYTEPEVAIAQVGEHSKT